jgi:hypothetical protein
MNYKERTEQIKKHWEDKLSEYKEEIAIQENTLVNGKPMKPEYFLRSYSDLIEAALRYQQYEGVDPELGVDYVKTTKLCRITATMNKEELEKNLGLECYTLYGHGLFAPVEGYVTTRQFREKSNYDWTRKRGVYFDLFDLEKEPIMKHLAVPFRSGLFIPVKSSLTSLLRSTRCIQVLEIDTW